MDDRKIEIFLQTIKEESVKTNRLLEKLIGILQAAAEPDISYHNEIASSGTARIPDENQRNF